MECPYSGSCPFLALACHILRNKDIMCLWWKSENFAFSFEVFLTMKIPNKQDLQWLIPSIWWPGSSEDEIEEIQRELCSLVICFVPPVSPPQSTGSVFRPFVQNLIIKARGGDHRMVASGTLNNTVLVSLYTVILHLLSEGFSMEESSRSALLSRINCGNVGFLHRGGQQWFPTQLLFRNDAYYSVSPIIGESLNHLLMFHQVDTNEDEVQWDEVCMNDEETRVAHTTVQKPCCCSASDATVGQRLKESVKCIPSTSKGPCKPLPERAAHVAAEYNGRSLSDEIEDKPSTSAQS